MIIGRHAYAKAVPTPPFILTLRAKIGHDLLWLSGVTAVVLDRQRVLLTRRRDRPGWHLVSGILEPGEQPAQAIVREVREETGVDVEVTKLVSVIAEDEMVIWNGDRCQFLDLCFRCRYVGGQAAVGDDENLEVAWYAVDDLPDLDDKQRYRLELALDDSREEPHYLR